MQKKKTTVSLTRALCPERCLDSLPAHLRAGLHPRHSCYQAVDEVSVRLLFDWRVVSDSCICEQSHGLCITDAVETVPVHDLNFASQGEGKCCHYCPGTSYVLPPSAPPSLFSVCSRSGSTDTSGFQRLFDMYIPLPWYWTLISQLLRKAFMWMHGSHSISLKLKECNRTILSFSQTGVAFQALRGPLIVKVAEGLGSWISQIWGLTVHMQVSSSA